MLITKKMMKQDQMEIKVAFKNANKVTNVIPVSFVAQFIECAKT